MGVKISHSGKKIIKMNTKKRILVTGGTGAQGGSVARRLLAENNFTVRILTRNPRSEKAQYLQQAGAEVAAGDMNSVQSLLTAMEGCYGVFGVTNFWEHFGGEYQQGVNLIDAVKHSGIEHFVLHTLPGYSKLSNGKYPTPHCDIKAALQDYTVDQGINASFVQVPFYYENFFSFFPPQPVGENTFAFGFPQGDTKLAMVSIEDLGSIVAPVFNNPAAYKGRIIGPVGADDTCAAYAAIMSKVLHMDIRYNYIERDTYASFEFPGAEELANMFEVQRLYIPNRQADLQESLALNPEMQSFESWVTKHKEDFKLLLQKQAAVNMQ
jgi:uncharacterized protein YbjT (DUF2867 family)